MERIASEGADDPAAVEHVTAYFKEHPDRFRTVYVSQPEAHNFPEARISVDTPADLKFLEEIYRRLEVPAGEANVTDVVKLLKAAPELLEINSGVRQKSAQEKTRRVIIRCDGDAEIGLGHVVRCLALAEELREVHSWGVTFAIEKGEVGIGMVAEAGFDIKIKPDADNEGQWLETLMESLHPDAFIMDIRTDLTRGSVARLKRFGSLIVDIDDPNDRRLEADMVFYPPVPQVKQMDWNGFKGHLFTGWEWVILRRQFADPPKPSKQSPNDPPVILVTMGGSDPAGMTLKTAGALESVKAPFKALFVIGSAYQNTKKLKDFLTTVKYPYEVKSGVQDMAALMTGVDLAVASFGVTAYELAVMKIPAAYLCLTNEHLEHARAHAEAGIALVLGLHDRVTAKAIGQEVGNLLASPLRLETMTKKMRSLVDGAGAKKIARIITERSIVPDA